MGTCLIVAAGPEAYWDGRFVPELVICADGGLRHAERLGLRTDVLIGDFDSLEGEYRGDASVIRLPAEKDMTDLEAAAELAQKRGADQIVIIGATGGRIDHYMAALSVLERLTEQGAEASLLDAAHEILIARGDIVRRPPYRYRYLSLCPLDAELRGVTLTGVKYPLDGHRLSRKATLGISNEPDAAAPALRICVKEGRCAVIFSDRI